MTKIRENKNLEFYDFDPSDRIAWEKQRKWISGMDDLSKDVRLGGSDVGVVLGLSEYKSRGALYYEMIGLKEVIFNMNAHIYRGQVIEDVIESGWWRYFDKLEGSIDQVMEAARTFKPLRKSEALHSMVINKKYPWLFANIDRLVTEELEGVLEIKSMYSTALEKWDGSVTPQYIVQLQDYILILELTYGELFVLSDATFPVLFPMDSNVNIHAKILEETKDFCDRVNAARAAIAKTDNEEDAWAAAAEFEPAAEKTLAYIKFLKEEHRPENLKDPYIGDDELLKEVVKYAKIKEKMAALVDDLVDPEVVIRDVFVKQKCDAIIFEGVDAKISWKKKFTLPYKKFI